MLQNFDERMKNLSIFYPVFKLKDILKYPEWDKVALGFGVLLYMLDTMLIGKRECTRMDMALFIKEMIGKNYEEWVTDEKAMDVLDTILDTLRNDGRPFMWEYQNIEKGCKEQHPLSLIEIAEYKVKEAARYKLTPQGMDMLFKTKEIFKELRITVSQLYFKEQIERGIFDDALATVKDLNLEVRELRERIEAFTIAINQKLLDVSPQEYEKTLEKIRVQFTREKKVFEEMRGLLDTEEENREKIDQSRMKEEEKAALKAIKQIKRELDVVVNEHDRLFNEKLNISSAYFRAFEQFISRGFSERVDFEKEFLERVIALDDSGDFMLSFLSPLWIKKNRKYFNLEKIFTLYLQQNERTKSHEEALIDVDEIEERERQREEQLLERKISNTLLYLAHIVQGMEKQEETTLKDILDALDGDAYYRFINSKDFYGFMISFHQAGWVDFGELMDNEKELVFRDPYNFYYLFYELMRVMGWLRDKKGITIHALEDEIRLENNSIISNYRLSWVV